MFLARTLGFVFSFALPLLLVRRLDQSAFGIYKQVFLFVGSAVAIFPLGVSMSAYYYLPREPEPARRQQVIFNLLIVNTFVGLLVCLALVIHPGLLTSLFHTAEMREHAPLVGVLILTWITSSLGSHSHCTPGSETRIGSYHRHSDDEVRCDVNLGCYVSRSRCGRDLGYYSEDR